MTKMLIFKSIGKIKLKVPLEVTITKNPNGYWEHEYKYDEILNYYSHTNLQNLRTLLQRDLEFVWRHYGDAKDCTKFDIGALRLRAQILAHVYGPGREGGT